MHRLTIIRRLPGFMKKVFLFLTKLFIFQTIIFGLVNSHTRSQVHPGLEKFLNEIVITVGFEVDYFKWSKSADTTFFYLQWGELPENVPTEKNIKASYAPLFRPTISVNYKKKLKFTYSFFLNDIAPFNEWLDPGPSVDQFINYGEDPNTLPLRAAVPVKTYIGGFFRGHELNIQYNLFPWLGVTLKSKKIGYEVFRPKRQPVDLDNYLPPYVYNEFWAEKYFFIAGTNFRYQFKPWQINIKPEIGIYSKIQKEPQEFTGDNYRISLSVVYGTDKDQNSNQSWWQYSIGYFYEKHNFGIVSTDEYHGFSGGVYYNF